MIRIFYLIMFILTLTVACRNSPSTSTKLETVDKEEHMPQKATADLEKLYPSLPPDNMRLLIQSVDYIDFMFYYADFSMNQSDDPSIKATLGHVASEVPLIDPSCQPIGSLFFLSKGKELMQAELYYTDKCIYFIWLQKGQRTYANKMTPSGFKFYQQVFTQAGASN